MFNGWWGISTTGVHCVVLAMGCKWCIMRQAIILLGTFRLILPNGQALKETAYLLEAVRATGVERLVYASTLTTVGFPKNPGHPANETCAFATRIYPQSIPHGQGHHGR